MKEQQEELLCSNRDNVNSLLKGGGAHLIKYMLGAALIQEGCSFEGGAFRRNTVCEVEITGTLVDLGDDEGTQGPFKLPGRRKFVNISHKSLKITIKLHRIYCISVLGIDLKLHPGVPLSKVSTL